jgi:hypothetical protein
MMDSDQLLLLDLAGFLKTISGDRSLPERVRTEGGSLSQRVVERLAGSAPYDPAHLALLLQMARDWTDPVVVRDAPERVSHVIEQLIEAIESLTRASRR